MSESDIPDEKFEVEVAEDTTISRDSMVEHAEHGPMHVDRVQVGPYGKRVQLQSELSNIGLELSDEELQEQWGETIAADPFELHDPGTAVFESESISVDGSDTELTLKSEGPESEAEAVHMHAVDQIVRGLEALRDGKPPAECDGAEFNLDWETILADEDGDDDE